MLNILKSHVSVREYTNEAITQEELQELLSAAQHAASSNFVQAYSVVQVTDEVTKGELARLSKNEKQFETAAQSLVFCADLKRVELALSHQPKEVKSDTYENFIVSIVDTALFAQNFVIACESRGYGICFIGGVRNNPEAISNLLELPDKVIPLFGMTLGVPSERNQVKPRFPIEAILHKNTYDDSKYSELIKQYNKIMAAYYDDRKINQKEGDWTSSMTDFMTDFRRPHMKNFLKKKGYVKR